MENKKFIIFTDLKNFTYKNSLLTDTQIGQILTKFESIITSSAEVHNITLVKSIGDSYLALSDNVNDTTLFSQEIVKVSQKYDTTQKLDLKKISLRVTLTYGHISEHISLNLKDYFGEAINMGSRIMDITPAGKIFCSEEVRHKLPSVVSSTFIGDFSFHGSIEKTSIYSLTPVSEQELNHLHHSENTDFQNCDDIIFRASCVAAVLSIQPIPFLENFNLIATHLYMILKISERFELEVNLKESSKIFAELITPLGVSFFALQGAGTAVKILLPGFGGLLFAPVSFGVSYALGKIYVMYFYYRRSGEQMTPELIKELFKKHKKDGVQLAKKEKNEIIRVGKKYSHQILSIRKEKNYDLIQKDTIDMLQSKK